ncbi:hypothetical protein BXZ70DRAFT_1064013 [Cristinia sonorae]|uniref:Uncharacterized protein n=1 Tax=Cristinia sonorae TaxID=1940300 RepID=A0A8K0XR47_9AGAR|nr:hypothetical protein BXZ70DRAFT_1064013 [Cristinia sonorae]
MINTAPKGVVLTGVVEPIKVNPKNVHLWWLGGGRIQLRGEVRFWNNTPSEVKLRWKSRDGVKSPRYPGLLSYNSSHDTNSLMPDSPSTRSFWFDMPSVYLKANSIHLPILV